MTKPIPPLDLSWLLLESPAGTTHVGAMLLFKKPARRDPVAEIVQAYRECTPTPPFNYVPELLVRGAPHFREVSSWDPHYHIEHLALPAGASYDDLLRLVADLHEPQLDRHRPLFRCWVIDGVPDDRFAIYTKTHHSIIDGESGLKRLYAGLSTTNRRVILKPAFALDVPPPEPHPPTPLTEKIADSIRGTVTEFVALNQVAAGALRKVFAGLVGSHLEGSLPFAAQHAPTNAPLEIGRRFATLTLPLTEMREIGHHFGATLNDVAVSVIDGGLHAYLRGTDREFAHPFIAMCPVSLRDADDTAIGTRVSAIFVRLGEPRASMPERIHQVVDSVATAKKEVGAMSKEAAMTYAVGLVALAGLGATTHLDRIARPACNLVISNVTGAEETRYLNGARLLGIYPVSALAASIGLNATLASYHDSMNFGFIANAAAIDDPTHLADLTLRAYQELKQAAGTRPAPRRVSS
ncbi:wax ester/triacylglycerol synthase family O-acyltransferase [Mycobacterium simiae]|uniref:Diacylglycerol O-acyltransferase n=2 Tax=Mycobacterium simiae TaxID=1784 RepID=A0A5B1BMI8_MYCSI|nr:wax ester/triacylglycerol synthase family O-acyltransferase [Mycobacterium simiae]